MLDLASARRKLGRTRQHLETIDKKAESFRKTNSCAVGFHLDFEKREKFWHVEGPGPRSPDNWDLVIGEALYALRSSLDHLAWQLVVVSGGTPYRRTAFPIFDDPDFFKKYAPAKMRGMSGRIQAEIKSMQPCFGGNPYRNDIFAALELLNNIDKHRHFNLLSAATMGGMMGPGMPARAEIYEVPIEHHAVLARVPLENMNVQFHPFLDVSFGEPGAAYGQSVQGLIIGMELIVGQTLDYFEDFPP